MPVGFPVDEPMRRTIRHLRYVEGLTVEATAARVGIHRRTVGIHAPSSARGFRGPVPVAPVAAAFLRSGMTAAEVARRMGWTDRNGKGQTSRLKRALGLMDSMCSRTGRRYRQETMTSETATLIAEALHLLPRDVGA